MLFFRKNRPLLALLLAGGLALVILSGCGDPQNNPADSATSAPTSAATRSVTTVVAGPTSPAGVKTSDQTASNEPSPAPTEALKPAGSTNLPTNGPATTVPTLVEETPARSTVAPVDSPPPLKSGIGLLKGHVVSAPGCPAVRAGYPCPTQPLSHRDVQIKAQNQADRVLKTATTDQAGYFEVELAPGSYTLEVTPASNSVERRKSYPFEIVAGQKNALEILVEGSVKIE